MFSHVPHEIELNLELRGRATYFEYLCSKCYKHSKVIPISKYELRVNLADFEPSAIVCFYISQT